MPLSWTCCHSKPFYHSLVRNSDQICAWSCISWTVGCCQMTRTYHHWTSRVAQCQLVGAQRVVMFMIRPMGSPLPAPSYPHCSCSGTAYGLGVYKATVQLSSDPENLSFPSSTLSMGGPCWSLGISVVGVKSQTSQDWEKRLVAQPATCRHFFGVVASLSLSIGAGWFFWGHETSVHQRVANLLYRLFLLDSCIHCPEQCPGSSWCRNWRCSKAY